MKVAKLHPCFAGEVARIDITGQLPGSLIEEIHAAMNQYAVLVFRGQRLDDPAQLAFTRQLGEVEASANVSDRLGTDQFSDISNLGLDNQPLAAGDERRMYGLGNMLWHTDSSFKEIPAKYSFLHCRITPSEGGETEFTDLRAAYDALPPVRKEQVRGLVAEHSLAHSRMLLGYVLTGEKARLQPARHPVAHRHQGSGRNSLYLAAHASHLVGWPIPEGRHILMELMEFATAPAFVYRHTWQVGDLVIWDNRCTMHRGRPYPMDAKRELRRTTISNAVALTALD